MIFLSAPPMGDESNLIWFLLIGVAAVVLVWLLFLRRKGGDGEE